MKHAALPVCLFLAVTFLVASQQSTWHYGPSWDEGHPNFPVALKQAQWMQGLFTLERPFSKATIDEYWETESDHPSLPKTIMAVSWIALHPWLEDAAALRFPAAVYFALIATVLFVWARREFGDAAGWFAFLGCLCTPHLFGHGHLASLDLPMTLAWLLAAWGYCRFGNDRRGVIIAGLLYAFAINVKLHSFFLPFPLLAWSILYRRWGDWRKIACMAVLGVTLYFAVQPWLWFDTVARLQGRFMDYAVKSTHNPIPVFYLGHQYLVKAPWHYPLVLTALGIPAALLILMSCGIALILRERQIPWLQHRPGKDQQPPPAPFYWLLNAATPISLVILPLAQPYDSTRLWLPSFPFFILLAAYGFTRALDALKALIPPQRQHHAAPAALALLFLPIAIETAMIHPYELSYYNEFAGGPAGAAKLGMETTFWSEAINRRVVESVNQLVPPDGKLRPMAQSFATWDWYRREGLLRADIRYEEEEPYDAHVVLFRQGFFSYLTGKMTNEMIPWVEWRCSGTPVVGLYGPLPGAAPER